MDYLQRKKKEFQNQMAHDNIKLLNKELDFKRRIYRETKKLEQLRDNVKYMKNNTKKCILCEENAKNSLITPCNHHCCCYTCGLKLEKCPICRINVTELLKIYSS